MTVTLAPPLTIDLSRMPLPSVLQPLDYAAIKAERLTKAAEVFQAAGIPFNSGKRESDAVVRLQEVDAYREERDKALINKTIRALLPAFSTGTDLENIAARANVTRLLVAEADPETGTPRIMESDANLVRRYLASFSAPSAGSEDAYIKLVADAFPGVWDVRPLGKEFNGKAGRVDVIVLAPGGVDPTADELLACRLAMRQTNRVPLTDDIVVRPARILRYTIEAHLIVPRGPDPELVRADAVAVLQALADQRYYVGGVLPVNALGLSYVPNVVRSIASAPLTDVGGPLDAAPFCEAINVTYEVLN